jgi:hypothetical protein
VCSALLQTLTCPCHALVLHRLFLSGVIGSLRFRCHLYTRTHKHKITRTRREAAIVILWDCLDVSLVAKCVLSVVNLFLPLCYLVLGELTNGSTTLGSEMRYIGVNSLPLSV